MSVLVYIQNFGGKLKKRNFELASYAFKIAQDMSLSLTGLVIGEIDNEELQKLSNYGVSKVLKVGDEALNTRVNRIYRTIVKQAVDHEEAKIIVFPDSNAGKAIAPRLSAKLKAGFISEAIAIPVTYEPFVVPKRAFSGKAIAHVQANTNIKLISLVSNSYGVYENPVEMSVEDFAPEYNLGESKINVVDKKPSEEGISLFDADIVVSGGRGMKAPENWGPLEELAEVLNAAKACSRPVSDDGWRPHTEHVGQTGKIIAPNLYFAIGISGAIQHVAGISGSKCIVALNNDSDAPIFQVADYGILGDAKQILPKLVEAFKEFKKDS